MKDAGKVFLRRQFNVDGRLLQSIRVNGNGLSQNVSGRSQQNSNRWRTIGSVVASPIDDAQCGMNGGIVDGDAWIVLVKAAPGIGNGVALFPLFERMNK